MIQKPHLTPASPWGSPLSQIDKVTTKRMSLYSGRTHPALAQEVAGYLGIELGEHNLVEFANGEVRPRFGESVRGSDVFIMQSHFGCDGRSINDSIMEQLIMIDAAQRASAKRITAVCPFYGYARQDRKAEGREPITARLIADLFKAAGAKRMVSIDLHSGQIQGFFDGPVDHLTAMPVIEQYIRDNAKNPVIVSPDAGRIKVAERHFLELIAESENLTNHLNAACSITGCTGAVVNRDGAADFVRITSTRAGRNFQFGMRYSF